MRRVQCNRNQSKHGKHKRLNQSDKHFHRQKRQGDKIRNQGENNNQKHLAGEDIPEQSERKRDNLGQFGD